jgi:hypothetical protein
LIHCVMAFCWAVEPSAFNVPVVQVGAVGVEEGADDEPAGVDAPAAGLLAEEVLLELEHALKTTAIAMRPARVPILYSFTFGFPLDRCRGLHVP